MQESSVRKVLNEIADMVERGDSKELILKYINGANDMLIEDVAAQHAARNITANNGAKPILG